MSDENVMDFYKTLGFEEIEIEDGLTALSFEVSPEENYALLTDEEGSIPTSLRQIIVFAYYTPEGAFLWSTSFKNSYLFQEIWSEADTPEHKLTAMQKYYDSKH